MAANVKLQMQFNGVYQATLVIPIDTCECFSVHPLVWLRYVGFTIYGVEGHISTLPDGPEVDYYQTDIQAGTYYYVVSEGESFFSIQGPLIHLQC